MFASYLSFPRTWMLVWDCRLLPNSWPKEPLAYVEWYGHPHFLPDQNTGMYVIKKTTESQYSIVTLTRI